MGIKVRLQAGQRRTWNGVRITNRGQGEAVLEIDSSNYLTEERDRRQSRQRVDEGDGRSGEE